MGPSFYVTAEVHTAFQWQEYEAAVETALNKALVEWGALALEAIVEAAPEGDRPVEESGRGDRPRLKQTFRLARPETAAFGTWRNIVVFTPDPNAIWQELGTRFRRRKRYKPSTNKPTNLGKIPEGAGNRGVPAKYFMKRALAEVEDEGTALVMRALAEVHSSYLGSSLVVDTVSPQNPRSPRAAQKRPSVRPRSFPLEGSRSLRDLGR